MFDWLIRFLSGYTPSQVTKLIAEATETALTTYSNDLHNAQIDLTAQLDEASAKAAKLISEAERRMVMVEEKQAAARQLLNEAAALTSEAEDFRLDAETIAQSVFRLRQL